jgi:hypothetical protein
LLTRLWGRPSPYANIHRKDDDDLFTPADRATVSIDLRESTAAVASIGQTSARSEGEGAGNA